MESIRELTYLSAVAQSAYPGFALDQAGDRYVVAPFEGGLLLGAIDGLGHGSKAAIAAIAAAEMLQTQPERSVSWLLEHCHRALQGTRGAAVSLVSVDLEGQRLEWAGVGNVAGVLLRAEGKHETLLTRGGVVGYRMPTVRPVSLEFGLGDTLILTSDGIRSGFLENAPLDDAPQALADYILAQSGRDTDDALVVVLRLLPA